MTPRAKVTPEFKAKAIAVANSSDKTRAEVAAELGIGKSTLGKWLAQAPSPKAEPTRTPPKDTALVEENTKLREEKDALLVVTKMLVAENA